MKMSTIFLGDVMWKSGKTWTMKQLKDLLKDEEINPNECTPKKLRSCIELLRGSNIKVVRSGRMEPRYFNGRKCSQNAQNAQNAPASPIFTPPCLSKTLIVLDNPPLNVGKTGQAGQARQTGQTEWRSR